MKTKRITKMKPKKTIGQKIPTKLKTYTPEELAYKKEYENFQGCYIFVNTNFKRKNEPIFVLAALEHRRRLSLPKDDLVFKTDEEIFKIIGNLVKNHFIKTGGKLDLWGKIANYNYHHKDGKSYVFDTNGNMVADEKVIESKAILSLK
jgi:hypothetical protein